MEGRPDEEDVTDPTRLLIARFGRSFQAGEVIYREGGEEWASFRDRLYARIVREQQRDGSWSGQVGPVYITSLNLIMLLLDRGLLPVYQR